MGPTTRDVGLKGRVPEVKCELLVTTYCFLLMYHILFRVPDSLAQGFISIKFPHMSSGCDQYDLRSL